MEIRCIICKQTEELTQEKLEKVGKFIEENSLDAVDFLNYLSLINGKTCTKDKKHKYEFTEEFDKKVHEIAKSFNDSDSMIEEANKIIEEQKKIIHEQTQIWEQSKGVLKEIAYINNPKLWL